jgi:hypothetical protein
MKLTTDQLNASVTASNTSLRALSAALSGALSDLHAHNRDTDSPQLVAAPLQAAANSLNQAADFLQRHLRENTGRLTGIAAPAAPGAKVIPRPNPLRSMLQSAVNMVTPSPSAPPVSQVAPPAAPSATPVKPS